MTPEAKEARVIWLKLVRNLRDMEQTMLKLLRLKGVPLEHIAYQVAGYQRVYDSILETQKKLRDMYPARYSWDYNWEIVP